VNRSILSCNRAEITPEQRLDRVLKAEMTLTKRDDFIKYLTTVMWCVPCERGLRNSVWSNDIPDMVVRFCPACGSLQSNDRWKLQQVRNNV
jgi:hypothetical protein